MEKDISPQITPFHQDRNLQTTDKPLPLWFDLKWFSLRSSVQISLLIHLHGVFVAESHFPSKVILTVSRIVLVAPARGQLSQLLLIDIMRLLCHHPRHSLGIRRSRCSVSIHFTKFQSICRMSIFQKSK